MLFTRRSKTLKRRNTIRVHTLLVIFSAAHTHGQLAFSFRHGSQVAFFLDRGKEIETIGRKIWKVGWNRQELAQLPGRWLVATLSGRDGPSGRVYFMLEETNTITCLKSSGPQLDRSNENHRRWRY